MTKQYVIERNGSIIGPLDEQGVHNSFMVTAIPEQWNIFEMAPTGKTLKSLDKTKKQRKTELLARKIICQQGVKSINECLEMIGKASGKSFSPWSLKEIDPVHVLVCERWNLCQEVIRINEELKTLD